MTHSTGNSTALATLSCDGACAMADPARFCIMPSTVFLFTPLLVQGKAGWGGFLISVC